jgi:ubiquinone/menaquinone biosynthesis C-methylase UbiE
MERTVAEINLLDSLPRSKRPIEERGRMITDDVRAVARQYGREFFDGDRMYGYGGYRYDGRWKPVAQRFRDHYALAEDARILDIGCAKGFLLHDFAELMPRAELAGLDISRYAIAQAMPSVRARLIVGTAAELPYPDRSFDLVISINTLHNLPAEQCAQALREVMRVSRGRAFVTVDAWRTEEERRRLMNWILTAYTYMSVEDWVRFFARAGYEGDYYWFIP